MIEKVKRYLRITWTSEDTDIDNMIERGKRRIETLTGTAIDFDTDLVAQDLLFDYCRYSYNNATEYFEDNFRSEILALQIHEAIKAGENVDPA